MMGMYEPSGGSIRINGADITKLRKKDIYRLYSAVFQDTMILPAMIDENIGRLVCTQPLIRLVNLLFRQRIQGRCRFIQQQDRRILVQRPGQQKLLFLVPGEVCCNFAAA